MFTSDHPVHESLSGAREPREYARGDIFRFMSPAQCRAARGLLGWTVNDLAKRAAVSRGTVHGFELERKQPHRATLLALRTAFESAGVRFIENGDGQGVRFAPSGEKDDTNL